MKGDFSRVTFDAENHYSRVLYQQGRVLTDADFNEQQAIGQHHARAQATHAVGRTGTPSRDAIGGRPLPLGGFAPRIADDGGLAVGAGHYYVEGFLCENEAEVSYGSQPNLPGAPKIAERLEAESATVGLIYLDVFERLRTALDRPELRESVLAGPDTTARAEVVWQLKVEPLPSIALGASARTDLAARAEAIVPLREAHAGAETEADRFAALRELREATRALAAVAAASGISCDAEPEEWAALTAPRSPRMAVETPPVAPDAGPCDAPPDAGFLGRENQLYLVEVHSIPGDGRRAGARFKWSRENGSVVAAVNRVGFATSGEAAGRDLGVDSTGRDAYLGFGQSDWVEYVDDLQELTEGPGDLRRIAADPEGNAIELDADVTVRFGLGPRLRRWDQASETRRRTTTATDTVANDASGVPMNAADDIWLLLEDNIWVSFADESYRPGDYWTFAARAASGTVEGPSGFRPADGVRHHYARLGYLLLGADGRLHVLLDCRPLFPALTAITAADVSFDDSKCDLADAETVQDAIERLCHRGGGGCCTCIGEDGDFRRIDEAIRELFEQGRRSICLCLHEGIHEVEPLGDLLEGLGIDPDAVAVELSIAGCGPTSRIDLRHPTTFRGLRSLIIRDVALDITGPVSGGEGLTLLGCREVTLERCHVWGNAFKGPLVFVDDARRLTVADSRWVAIGLDTFSRLRDFLSQFDEPILTSVLADDIPPHRLSAALLKFATALVRTPDEQDRLEVAVNRLLAAGSMRDALGREERLAYERLVGLMDPELLRSIGPPGVAEVLGDVRTKGIRARPGVALAVGLRTIDWDPDRRGGRYVVSTDRQVQIRANQIDGMLLLYGFEPWKPPADDGELDRLLGEVRGSISSLLSRAGGTLQITENVLARLTVAEPFMVELRGLPGTAQASRRVHQLFRECSIAGNVIAGPNHTLVGGRITATGNFFTEPLPQDQASGPPLQLGLLAAQSILATSNQGEGTGDSRLRLFVQTLSTQIGPNLNVVMG